MFDYSLYRGLVSPPNDSCIGVTCQKCYQPYYVPPRAQYCECPHCHTRRDIGPPPVAGNESVVNPQSGARFFNAHETHGKSVPPLMLEDPVASLERRASASFASQVDKVRDDKAVDFLLDRMVALQKMQPTGYSVPEAAMIVASRILVLEATRNRPDLPNRKRLLELVEAAMPKEDGK